jgi:hypothetical protein
MNAVKEDGCMNGYLGRKSAAHRQTRGSRRSGARVGCEALEGRQLLSRGMGLDALGLGGMGAAPRLVSMKAEHGSFAGGGPGAMFGAGKLGVGGGTRDPIFLLTASLLNTGSGTTTLPSRSVLSSSAVQSAFQTLQTDFNNDVTVGSKPTHASIGQLQDDFQAIRKGTLTGSAATTAIQNDEAAILTSMGLSSTQVSQLQADLQAVQSAIQSAGTSGSGSTTTSSSGSTDTTTTGTTTTTGDGTTTSSTDTGSTTAATAPLASSTSTPTQGSTTTNSALQTLQTEIKNDTPTNAQPTHASIGQLQDDLDAISKGTLTGSQALTTIQNDTAAVFTSEGMTQTQVTQIQADQTALGTAIQAAWSQAGGSTTSTGSNSSPSPTSIAAVKATMQSVQPYLVGVPGLDATQTGAVAVPATDGLYTPSGVLSIGGMNGASNATFVSKGGGAGIGAGGPVLVSRGGAGSGAGGPIMVTKTDGAGSGAGGPIFVSRGGAGSGAGGPVLVSRGGAGSGAGGPIMTTRFDGSGAGGPVAVNAGIGGGGPVFVSRTDGAGSGAGGPIMATRFDGSGSGAGGPIVIKAGGAGSAAGNATFISAGGQSASNSVGQILGGAPIGTIG